jgi:lipoprotein-releasing system ATP-binding protein
VLQARGLGKRFAGPAGELAVLEGLELEVSRGELLAIVGESGAGKSTLLYLLAGLDRPTAGVIFFEGKPLANLSEAELAAHRNAAIGFVWQLSNLLLDFTAAENVMLPLLVRGESPEAARNRAEAVLAEVGLSARADHLAGELSGGEAQRVALARALVTEPRLLLADEPTGNLDEVAAAAVFALLEKLHRSRGLTSVIATHNVALAGFCDRIVRLEHGRLHPMRVGSQG